MLESALGCFSHEKSTSYVEFVIVNQFSSVFITETSNLNQKETFLFKLSSLACDADPTNGSFIFDLCRYVETVTLKQVCNNFGYHVYIQKVFYRKVVLQVRTVSRDLSKTKWQNTVVIWKSLDIINYYVMWAEQVLVHIDSIHVFDTGVQTCIYILYIDTFSECLFRV